MGQRVARDGERAAIVDGHRRIGAAIGGHGAAETAGDLFCRFASARGKARCDHLGVGDDLDHLNVRKPVKQPVERLARSVDDGNAAGLDMVENRRRDAVMQAVRLPFGTEGAFSQQPAKLVFGDRLMVFAPAVGGTADDAAHEQDTVVAGQRGARMGGVVAKAMADMGYRGAGTIEFLWENGEFFFIEMNTRIQVEHPVTEMICGVDLVGEMIRIAGGEKLRLAQAGLRASGHAIEVRLNAEDPANNFMPFPGQIAELTLPDGPGVRFDHMLYRGYQIPPFYDSLLGKLIVWGEDREHAMARLGRALGELSVTGLPTTAPLFQALLASDDVRASAVHTRWLEPWLEENQHMIMDRGGAAA